MSLLSFKYLYGGIPKDVEASIPFFGDSTSSNAFDGKQGRSGSSGTPAAGFFGSGGGGSGAGSGFEGGPGAVILWWS